jgi:hypothetical protein
MRSACVKISTYDKASPEAHLSAGAAQRDRVLLNLPDRQATQGRNLNLAEVRSASKIWRTPKGS